jgi:heat-inducible transcriptional repressor
MNDRQKLLLHSIIKEYIKRADPIPSSLLVNKYKLDLSPATVRNEMIALEEEEYLYQPHTSAGRVPTEKAYKFYVENFMEDKSVDANTQHLLKNSLKEKDIRAALKNLAKNLALVSNDVILVGFAPFDVYYTGLSNLFSKPEFQDIDVVVEMSAMVDHLDEAMSQLFNSINDKTKILIGRENPFGEDCSAILVKNQKAGLIGLVGPIRMDYDTNTALIKCVRELI